MNLSDSKKSAESFDGFDESYYAGTTFVALSMGVAYDTEEFRSKLAKGLRFFASHEGPYAIHCVEGKDRTGIVAALLECFMGASCEEVKSDYMLSFYIYYGIEPEDAAYKTIWDRNVKIVLQELLGVEDIENADLAQAAKDYFQEIGLNDEEIRLLHTRLEKR